jgi:hypothetical protein
MSEVPLYHCHKSRGLLRPEREGGRERDLDADRQVAVPSAVVVVVDLIKPAFSFRVWGVGFRV